MFDTLYILALRSINTKIEKLKNNIPTEITEKNENFFLQLPSRSFH